MDSLGDGNTPAEKEVSVVSLIIKCPTNSNDFTIQMPVEATVLAVKQRLQRDYAGNPDPSRQRLIVAGVVLNDGITIQDTFKQKNLEEPQVMHLSILPLPSAATPSRSTAGASTSFSPASSSQTTFPSETTPDANPPIREPAAASATPPPRPASPIAAPPRFSSGAQHVPPSVGTSSEQAQEAGNGSEAGPPQTSEAAAGGSGASPEGAPAMNPDAVNQAVLQMMYGGGVLPFAFNPALAALNAAALLNPAAMLPLLYPGLYPPMYPTAYFPMPPPGDAQAQTPPFPPPQQPPPQGGGAPGQAPPGGPEQPLHPHPPPFGLGLGAPGPGGLPGDPYGMLPVPFPFGAPFPMMAPAGVAAPPPGGAQVWHALPPGVPVAAWHVPPGGAPVQGQPRPEAEALGLRQRHAPPAANGQPDLANAAGARAPGVRRQVVWHFRLQFRLDLMLILKLAIVVFVFNQDGSPDRLLFFITIAVLVYLYQTGALTPLVRWIRANTDRALRPVQLQPPPAQPQGPPPQPAAGVDPQIPRPNDGQAPPERVVVENQAPGAAAAVNRIPGWGIIREISMFVLGFVTSLLPGFQGGDEHLPPQAPQVARGPAQPAVADGRPHQD